MNDIKFFTNSSPKCVVKINVKNTKHSFFHTTCVWIFKSNMTVRGIFTVCSGICKRFSRRWFTKRPPPQKVSKRFSRRKHLRYRRRLRFARRLRLKPIEEHSTEEYLETDCQPYNELKLSISDRMLTRLNKGWTLKETFGLKPEPKKLNEISIGQKKYPNNFTFGSKIKLGKVRRKLNYNSLLTEFLSDMQIMNT